MIKTPEAVSIEEASPRLGELARLALEGTPVLITEAGEPVVRLVPVAAASDQPRIAGLNEGKVWIADDFDAELPDEFWFPEE
jgi:prevent-host-death family protein